VSRAGVLSAAVLAIIVLAGCNSLPGKPRESDRPISPSQIKSFTRLFADNCAGCHGTNGRFGAAYELANPNFQAMVDDAALSGIVSQGMAGTAMPPFAQKYGGFLTDAQVRILVDGMRRRWRKGGAPQDAPPLAQSGGDAARGAQVFAQSCAPCHGAAGEGGVKAPGSIVNPSYLMLVSDDAIRTLIIGGRTDLGHPDWRGYPPGQPLSAQQVGDLVAWLASKRPQFAPGTYARNP
jgi:mono/diheme cytochrome c family protein